MDISNAYLGCDETGTAIHVYSSCGVDEGVYSVCDEITHCEATDGSAVCACSNHWEGELCRNCPVGWDPAADCAECANSWTGENCDICPEHFDPDSDCAVCAIGWGGASCDTCAENFSIETECTSCAGSWTGERCDICPPQWNAEDNCESCAANWTGPDCATQLECIFYVNGASAASSPQGRTWEDAFPSIQPAIDAATATIENSETVTACSVWVARGTYAVYAENKRDSIVLAPGISLFGGFSGTESFVDERSPDADETILSGLGADESERVYTIVTGASNSVLDGFTITGGDSDGNNLILISSCGAGVFAYFVDDMTVRSCKFIENHATAFGAAIYSVGNNVQIEDCVFDDHMSGAVYLDGDDSSIRRSLFLHNLALDGSALYLAGGNVEIENAVFSDNFGDTVFIEDEAAECSVVNSTFYNDFSGSAIRSPTNNFQVYNSIFWGDGEVEEIPFVAEDGSIPQVYYSNLPDNSAGTGNISAEPLFTDPESRDFTLQADSPCIDAAYGDRAPSADFNENQRVDVPSTVDTGGGTPSFVDIGAYEYQN